MPYYPSAVSYQPLQQQVQPYWLQQNHMPNQMVYNPYPTPYPKASSFTPPQTSGMSSVMNSFKKTDGNLDFNKMVDTAGQLMGTMNQLSSLFKGVTSFIK